MLSRLKGEKEGEGEGNGSEMEDEEDVRERSERALRKTSIPAMDLAKWLQT